MSVTAIISSITTVVTFVVFLLIVWWAYGLRKKRDFDDAANEPFALPEESSGDVAGTRRGRP
jgi:cbb3-type cytochrome oxidase subunit 3